jgi:hypothetical protein
MKRSHFVISLIPVSDQLCLASAGLFLATEFSSGLKAAAICCWRERASMIETLSPARLGGAFSWTYLVGGCSRRAGLPPGVAFGLTAPRDRTGRHAPAHLPATSRPAPSPARTTARTICLHERARRADVRGCLSPDGDAAWGGRQNAVRNPSPHVAAFNWVQVMDVGLARNAEHRKMRSG